MFSWPILLCYCCQQVLGIRVLVLRIRARVSIHTSGKDRQGAGCGMPLKTLCSGLLVSVCTEINYSLQLECSGFSGPRGNGRWHLLSLSSNPIPLLALGNRNVKSQYTPPARVQSVPGKQQQRRISNRGRAALLNEKQQKPGTHREWILRDLGAKCTSFHCVVIERNRYLLG